MMKEIEKGHIFRDKLETGRKSQLKTYMELVTGLTGPYNLLKYELITGLMGLLPGGFGLFIRKMCYPQLFKGVGRGIIIGRNVTIRHPDKITLGENVTIDDNCLIDARGAGPDGIVFDDGVIINRNCMIQAKSGPIRFGRRTSIGSNCVIVSMDGIELEEEVLMAGGCYISAGLYHTEDLEKTDNGSRHLYERSCSNRKGCLDRNQGDDPRRCHPGPWRYFGCRVTGEQRYTGQCGCIWNSGKSQQITSASEIKLPGNCVLQVTN